MRNPCPMVCLGLLLLAPMLGCGDDHTSPVNHAPRIQEVSASPDTVRFGGQVDLVCHATDEDGDELSVVWSSSYGVFPLGTFGVHVVWQPPDLAGLYAISTTVSDGSTEVGDSVFIAVNAPPGAPFSPTPPDSGMADALSTCLGWECTDPDGGPIRYDVYFGASPTRPLVSADQVDRSYDPGQLQFRQSYQWHIVAKDDLGNTTVGPIWRFETCGATERVFELGTTGVYITMAWLPPGTFMMGAPGTQGAGDDESPSHQVDLGGFWIGVHEVTQAQWEAVMGHWSFEFAGHPSRPAEMISWSDTRGFLAALNAVEVDDPWRLPTEAEWEYAARAGHYDTRFWWGDDPQYRTVEDHAWISSNSGGQTHDVGTTPAGQPSPFGLWDMGGNVWEWCEDWYHPSYVGAPSDGSAWTDPPGTQRVFRGGSYFQDGRRCLPNLRSMYNQTTRYSTFGFRLVRDGNG